MNLMPHDHLMWANIGIYTGREDNIFWTRSSDGIKAHGAEALFVKDTASLPEDAVHSVTNPLLRFTGGIHIYGGDFSTQLEANGIQRPSRKSLLTVPLFVASFSVKMKDWASSRKPEEGAPGWPLPSATVAW